MGMGTALLEVGPVDVVGSLSLGDEEQDNRGREDAENCWKAHGGTFLRSCSEPLRCRARLALSPRPDLLEGDWQALGTVFLDALA